MPIKVAAAIVLVIAILFIVIITCVCTLSCQRYFARKTKRAQSGATGAKRETEEGGAIVSKVLNDVIAWIFCYTHQWIDEWTEAWVRALTIQAANEESQEDFQVRFEKIVNVEAAPQLSNLSTEFRSTEKSLVILSDVIWRRFELVLSLTPRRSTNAIYSIDCHVLVFEFHGTAELLLLSSGDGSKFTARFTAEPKMKLEVKPNQEADINVQKLEQLIRHSITRTEVLIPLLALHSSGSSKISQPENFEQQYSSTISSSQLSTDQTEQKRKLLVKVIKANGLVTSQDKDYGSQQPFCVALMDSPAQKYVTSSVKNTANPFFGEQFVFDIDKATKKLTFELHDKEKSENDDFLGMAVLTTDDLVRTRHVLPLTGKGPMTFGALTVEVTVIDTAQIPFILSISPNVEHIPQPGESSSRQTIADVRQSGSIIPGTSGFLGSPDIKISEADVFSHRTLETPTVTPADPDLRESKSLPRMSALPPKGDLKKRSLVSAIKKRFRRTKPDSRSQSADRALEKQSLGEGIYLTPPPSRASASSDYEEIPEDGAGRSRSNSVRSSLRRLFHVRRQGDSPTRPSGHGIEHSPEGSVGHPSPRLRSASANPELSRPSATVKTTTGSELKIR